MAPTNESSTIKDNKVFKLLKKERNGSVLYKAEVKKIKNEKLICSN